MVSTQSTYIITPEVNRESFLSQFRETYHIAKEAASRHKRQYFDTFDWRLFKNNMGLMFEDKVFSLFFLDSELTKASVDWTRQKLPRFSCEFPESLLEKSINPVLDIRALMLLANIQQIRTTYRLMNEDHKTVARIHIDSLDISSSDQKVKEINILEIQPLRGYEDWLIQLRDFCIKSGLAPSEETELSLALSTVGFEPGAYSSKFKVQLDSSMTADQAVRTIYIDLLQTVRQNKPGILQDIDIEFLHDYRVALRRMRSGLSLMQGVLPESWTNRFKQAFRDLMQYSNSLRDLDVYLLSESEYRTLLPDSLQAGLDPLFLNLVKVRKKELRKVIKSLNAPVYHETLDSWEQLLHTPAPQESGPHAKTPVMIYASQLIYEKYQKVVVQGGKIKKSSPDEKLHRLRIHCKKLRYMLEFFASLYPEEEIMFLIKQLKRLQDNLGEFNDLYVQQLQLEENLANLQSAKNPPLLEVAAVGGLLAMLNQRQGEVRKEFQKRFNAFSNTGNKTRFEKLFHQNPMERSQT